MKGNGPGPRLRLRPGGYCQRRPTIGIPGSSVLQVGTDAGGTNIGLHPRLTGLQQIFTQGRLAIVQRTGYPNSSRSHFLGTDIWSTADPSSPSGPGWLGRYLELLPQPLDPLTAWSTVRETPRTFYSRFVGTPAIPDPRTYAFASPNSGAEAFRAREAAVAIASHVPVDRRHLSFVSGTSRSALATLDRVASVAQYQPSVEYPANGLGSALRAVAGAMVRGIGTKAFWVQTGGYDTHASQNPNVVSCSSRSSAGASATRPTSGRCMRACWTAGWAPTPPRSSARISGIPG